MPRVAVITDSTAYLPPELAGDITVVPLTVAIGGVEGVEGKQQYSPSAALRRPSAPQIGPAEVAAALRERPGAVSTSRPSPEHLAETYRRVLAAGASGIVSVHLSAELSGTYQAAVLAAAEVDPDRVTVVDSRSTGMGLGFCALAAADAAAAGADLAAVAQAAVAAVGAISTFFYVDTLEFLRRGGRISAASALLGTALSVKPILYVADGAIAARDKVRTASRALNRLVDLAVEAAGESDVEVAVHHLAAAERARDVGDALAGRLGERLRQRWTSEVGAVVAAHVGPGLVGVVVHRVG